MLHVAPFPACCMWHVACCVRGFSCVPKLCALFEASLDAHGTILWHLAARMLPWLQHFRLHPAPFFPANAASPRSRCAFNGLPCRGATQRRLRLGSAAAIATRQPNANVSTGFGGDGGVAGLHGEVCSFGMHSAALGMPCAFDRRSCAHSRLSARRKSVSSATWTRDESCCFRRVVLRAVTVQPCAVTSLDQLDLTELAGSHPQSTLSTMRNLNYYTTSIDRHDRSRWQPCHSLVWRCEDSLTQ
jgi:hypothetical protein